MRWGRRLDVYSDGEPLARRTKLRQGHDRALGDLIQKLDTSARKQCRQP